MDVNSTVPYAFVPFVNTIQILMKTVSIFVGGIFGLYFMLFIWRIYTYKRNRSLFKGMRRDFKAMQKQIDGLEKKIDILSKKTRVNTASKRSSKSSKRK